jgi:TetR/AcrR family transcriptional regulator, transcriptional repressor for nem operon
MSNPEMLGLPPCPAWPPAVSLPPVLPARVTRPGSESWRPPPTSSSSRAWRGTTLDDVRAEAGVSSSQIYHYFADKEALVRAVVDYQAQTIVGEIHEPALAAIEGIDGLRAWRDMIVSIQRDADCRGGCPLGSLGSELAELDQLARGDVAAGYARWEAAISACLTGMRDRGQLSAAADPAQLATAVLAALQGGLLLAKVERDVRPLAAALDVMISLIASLAPAGQGDPTCL